MYYLVMHNHPWSLGEQCISVCIHTHTPQTRNNVHLSSQHVHTHTLYTNMNK